MATKRTYIGVDEELVVKGRLTIEGNVTQIESTQEVNRVESNVFVINSDGTAGTTTLALKSGSDFANLTFAGTNLISSQTITSNILIPNTGSLVISSGATLSGNTFTGVANEAGALTNDRTLALTGDVAGSVALGLNSNTSSPSMSVTIQPNSVALGTDTVGNYVASVTGGTGLTSTVTSGETANPIINLDNTSVTAAAYGANASTVSNFTVDAQGRLTAAANQPISITTDQISNLSVTDAGGDGSLTYSSATGVITYTGPSQAEANSRIAAAPTQVRAHLSHVDAGGDGSFSYNNTTGVFTYTGPNQTEANARIDAAPLNVRAHVSGGTGISYSNATGVITTNDSQIDIHSLSGYVANEHIDHSAVSITAGTGLTGGGTIASTRTLNVIGGDGITANANDIAVDSTVVRTTGTQTVTGDKTFTGTVDLSGATLPGNVNFAGNITATNIDTVTQTDSIVTDNNIYLNKGGSDRDAKIQVEHTTANVYLKWDEGTDRWQFSNDGSTDYNMLIESDVEGFFSVSDAGGDGSLSYSAGVFTYTGPNQAEANARISAAPTQVRAHLSVTDAGGDGSLAYNNGTGVITYTGPSASETRAHFSGSTGITLNSGAISITNSGVSAGTYGTSNDVAQITVNAQGQITGASDVAIDHDALANFVANEHIDHTAVTLTAGNGLSGGGDISASRTFALDLNELSSAAVDVANDSIAIIDANDSNASKKESIADLATAMAGSGLTSTNGVLSTSGFTGTIESVDVGGTGQDILQGSETLGNGTIRYYIRSIDGGTYTTSSESSNVITIDGNITAIRGGFSVTDAGGDGSLSYNNSNGVFTYTGPSASETRAHLSGTGLIGYNSGTGVISTTADNYGSWQFTTDSAGNEAVSSDELVTFVGGTGVDVTHSGNTITINQDIPVGDITAVTAGDGLSGGGTSGAVTLTANIQRINTSSPLGVGNPEGPNVSLTWSTTSINTSTSDSDGDYFIVHNGTPSSGSSHKLQKANINLSGFNNDAGFTTNTGDIESVTAGVGLTGGGTSGAVSLSVGSGYGISTTATTVEVANADIRGLFTGSSGINYNSSTGAITADSSEIRGLFSSSGDIAYNSSTGEFSFTNDAGDISAVNAGTGLIGGGTTGAVTLNVSGLTVSELSAGTLQTSGESFSNDDTSLMTSAAIEDKILSYGYTTNVGDITAVVAGNGLSGGASSGSANVNVGAGNYIVVNANDVAVDATTTNTANKVVARDSNGNVAATYFNGTATSAHYADLAEVYEADADYEPGTVLVIGGNSEVTIADEPGSYKVIGVVSTDPAYLMNSQANGVAIALRGRVPCKVTGNVNKGDVLIASDTPGHAMVAVAPSKLSPLQIVGRALENKLDASTGIIEIIV